MYEILGLVLSSDNDKLNVSKINGGLHVFQRNDVNSDMDLGSEF